MDISKFERAGVLQILLYLIVKKKKVMVSELYRQVHAAFETTDAAIKFLAINGLVFDEKITSCFPKRRLVSLTVTGEAVAQCLKCIDLLTQ
jgi:hypothetical protein